MNSETISKLKIIDKLVDQWKEKSKTWESMRQVRPQIFGSHKTHNLEFTVAEAKSMVVKTESRSKRSKGYNWIKLDDVGLVLATDGEMKIGLDRWTKYHGMESYCK